MKFIALIGLFIDLFRKGSCVADPALINEMGRTERLIDFGLKCD